jgi:transposase
MHRMGEDVSEKLDITSARLLVHRHIHGKWACKCCQLLRQEPAEPDVVDGGVPASGQVAHTLISRFVGHLPYCLARAHQTAPWRAHAALKAGWLGWRWPCRTRR